MNTILAARLTRAASKQTYYTIRFLVDRARVDDAYRAYAYFRWIDDVLDAGEGPDSASGEVERSERVRFLDRQRSLLERCLRGEPVRPTDQHEAMLVELCRRADGVERGLDAYLRHMMLVMDFDVRRRGRLITETELADYTRWLAIAVTEAMHHFIGNGDITPDNEMRYAAATGAHIVHMLRDTDSDTRAGYINIPREVLETHRIDPKEVRSGPYRAWVESRVRLARAYFDSGRAYLAGVPSLRHRLAALAYVARFEWLAETLEEEDFVVRTEYAERRSLATALRMAGHLASSLVGPRRAGTPTHRTLSRTSRP